MSRRRARAAGARPFELVRGVPAALVRALDRGDPLPEAWRVPLRVSIYKSQDERMVPFAMAEDYGAALLAIVAVLVDGQGGDPEAYPLASPEVLALVEELRDPALRELCLLIDNTCTACWPEDVAESLYLHDLKRAFPGERFVVGWEATGPMVDLAWAFLVRGA